MVAFQRGDDAAFDRLVALAAPDVVGLARRYGLDDARADDLAQETFLRVWRSRTTYQPTARFKSWLLRIAANLVVSDARSRKRARTGALPQGEEGEEVAIADPRAEAPDDRLLETERARAVQRALADLPETQRIALLMNRFHEASYQEVGEALSLSVEAVKSLLFRARQSLKARLEEFMGEEGA